MDLPKVGVAIIRGDGSREIISGSFEVVRTDTPPGECVQLEGGVSYGPDAKPLPPPEDS